MEEIILKKKRLQFQLIVNLNTEDLIPISQYQKLKKKKKIFLVKKMVKEGNLVKSNLKEILWIKK